MRKVLSNLSGAVERCGSAMDTRFYVSERAWIDQRSGKSYLVSGSPKGVHNLIAPATIILLDTSRQQ